MSELFYVGKGATAAREVVTTVVTNDLLSGGVGRDHAQERIDTAVALKAAKGYVDTQDNLYESPTYYPTQDALLVPNAAKGAASGVASLDSSGVIPSAQVPYLGTGVLKGPYGPLAGSLAGPTTGTTPAKICEWPATGYAVNGQPLVFMNVSTTATADRTVIEIRIGNPSQTTYAAQTLIARGVGRGLYTDWQTITVLPVPALDNESQDGIQDVYAASTNWLITAWMFNTGSGSSATAIGQISTAALFWARAAL